MKAQRAINAAQLSSSLVRVLRQGFPQTGLSADDAGWFTLEEVARALSVTLQVELVVADIVVGEGREVEVLEGRIRLVQASPIAAPLSYPPPYPRTSDIGPDILYHVVSRQRLSHIRSAGVLAGVDGRPVPMTRMEEHAWRIGHRRWEDPFVFYIDAGRARRDGLKFHRNRVGQYQIPVLPIRHVLNLRENFAEQASAGGFLVDWSKGEPRIALVRVSRRSGITWEVAKGKIEVGELPEQAAIRELKEEMGVKVPVIACRSMGTIRYGFSTPDGQPRLKTIYLYLLEATEPILQFAPARQEGIDAVRWFSVDEAIRLMTHPSLKNSVGRLVSCLESRAEELGIRLD
jgi:8-oxo-dGTP pyrophosphatase MutT (NUDIX family)/RNA:NAD 2'-phosphotransferase (TPT1/KptA family)